MSLYPNEIFGGSKQYSSNVGENSRCSKHLRENPFSAASPFNMHRTAVRESSKPPKWIIEFSHFVICHYLWRLHDDSFFTDFLSVLNGLLSMNVRWCSSLMCLRVRNTLPQFFAQRCLEAENVRALRNWEHISRILHSSLEYRPHLIEGCSNDIFYYTRH